MRKIKELRIKILSEEGFFEHVCFSASVLGAIPTKIQMANAPVAEHSNYHVDATVEGLRGPADPSIPQADLNALLSESQVPETAENPDIIQVTSAPDFRDKVETEETSEDSTVKDTFTLPDEQKLAMTPPFINSSAIDLGSSNAMRIDSEVKAELPEPGSTLLMTTTTRADSSSTLLDFNESDRTKSEEVDSILNFEPTSTGQALPEEPERYFPNLDDGVVIPQVQELD